jgi:molybdenum cofactor cytidylyltransferase
LTIAAAVLAAGAGARFQASGGTVHKLLTNVRGRPLLEWALEAVAAAGFDEIVVVTGSAPLNGVLHGRQVREVHNPAWAGGIATSLTCAVRAAAAGDHEAVVVGLGDQPGVPAAAWRAVAGAPADPPIAVATYDGRRGNPVRLHRSVWDRLPVSGDEGARALMRAEPHLVVEIPCPGAPFDVDVVEDLDRWS